MKSSVWSKGEADSHLPQHLVVAERPRAAGQVEADLSRARAGVPDIDAKMDSEPVAAAKLWKGHGDGLHHYFSHKGRSISCTQF